MEETQLMKNKDSIRNKGIVTTDMYLCSVSTWVTSTFLPNSFLAVFPLTFLHYARIRCYAVLVVTLLATGAFHVFRITSFGPWSDIVLIRIQIYGVLEYTVYTSGGHFSPSYLSLGTWG